MAIRKKTTLSGYRAGFVFVVCLLAAVSGFTLYAEIRTNEKVDALVSHALERHELIGRIRVDALNLEGAVADHIRGSDAERAQADEQMAQTLDDIRTASQEYTQALPEGERELWKQFNTTCKALALQVHTAVNYSNRKLAEQARQHLVEKIRPVIQRVDELANQLSEKNAEETQQLLRNLEELRFNTTLAGTLVALIAVVLALLVGWSVSALVQRQELTIHEQMAELDSRNRELDAFASRVAHDLVSPLAPLKGYLTLIRRSDSVADPQVIEMLSLAEASAGRMAELIEALLRFCRAGIRSESGVSDLDTAVSTILLELSQTAANQGVRLERLLDGPVSVACSAQLLQSIAQNVLSNAVKYTAGRPEPKVVVRVGKERNEAVLEVTDNGSGMSESSQKALFQPFFRAPEARGLPGHGLGMATTKRLVEAHGGSILVRSQLSIGTQVFVRLPLSGASKPPAVNAS
jgi:two-component system, OmpR family, sensor kinase